MSTITAIASNAAAQFATKVTMANAQGQSIGMATLTARSGGGVQIALDVKVSRQVSTPSISINTCGVNPLLAQVIPKDKLPSIRIDVGVIEPRTATLIRRLR